MDKFQLPKIAFSVVYQSMSIILRHYRLIGSDDIFIKQDRSPLTQADIESNRIICSYLAQKTSYPILSEENKDDLDRLNNQYVWLVDPLDGTKEFLTKNGEFTVNIALVRDQVPILGIIAVPAKNLIYHAIKGHGAYVRQNNRDKKINCSKIDQTDQAKIAISRSHLNPRLEALLKKNGLYNCVSLGSALKYCQIAEGLVDATLRKTPLREWDIAAADCILSEAGGYITDFHGEKLRYNKREPKFDQGIVATNYLLHETFLDLVKALI